MLAVPSNPEQLTAGWLTAALASRNSGVVVDEVTQDRVIHGAATKVRLLLRYNAIGRACGLPDILWAKSGWEPHGLWLDTTTAISAREARFYAQFVDIAGVNAPRCYFTASEPNGRGIVLLEDLNRRKVRFGACRNTESVSQATRMIETLAKLHAPWWDSPHAAMVKGLDVPMRRGEPSSEWPRANGPDVIARYLATARGRDIPARIKSPERIDAAFWAMIDHMSNATPACVLHGDAHPGNSFFDPDGSAGLYDWQTLSFGPWAHDVSYYICTALGVLDRRQADRHLLRHYLTCLRNYGVADPPDFETAWLAHRRYIAYGLHIWMTNPVQFQAEENCIAMVERLAAAAADYDFFEVWGV